MNLQLDRDVLKSLGAAFRKERASELDTPLPDHLRRLCDDIKRAAHDLDGLNENEAKRDG